MVAALAEPVAASLSPSKMLAVVITAAPGPCAKLPSGCCRVRSQAMVSASSAGVRLCHWLCNAHPVSSKLAPPSVPVFPRQPPPATLRSARPALAIEPSSLCKWLWQTSAWVLVEASDGRVLVSVTTAGGLPDRRRGGFAGLPRGWGGGTPAEARGGLLPDRRSRGLAVSQRAWVGATSAEARLSWPSLRIWLCSHARPEPIGSAAPRAAQGSDRTGSSSRAGKVVAGSG